MVLFLLAVGGPRAVAAATLESDHPGLATGMLKSAVLAPLDKDTLLIADGVTIKETQLLAGIQDQEPKLRVQLENNLFFLLEQEATRRILIDEARKAGIVVNDPDDSRPIQTLLEQQTKAISVSEDEARAFYSANREMIGDAPFEQAADPIRQYLLQEKKQQAINDYIADLGRSRNIRINQAWVQAQSRLAADNPVDRARRSGKPTLLEFGAAGCVPCDMMQPILDNLRKDFGDRLNVVFVHVGEEQVLGARYGIQSIPVQVFYDAGGQEVSRHVGFFAQEEVLKQLARMGVEK
ncbi:MAG: thioredoxin family protein [Desulfobacteraceae bacterium]|nr:thioredoxin family protein [Desulfobacteraceae bacterium]